MPRAFTERERALLRRRLLDEASRLALAQGMRRTRIEALTDAAGISKGAFYQFFPSKEALFIELLREVEAALRARLDALDPSGTPRQALVTLLTLLFRATRDHPMMALIHDPDEMRWLWRSLTPEQLSAELRSDDDYFVGLFQRWQARGRVVELDPSLLARLPRVAFALQQQRELVGEDRFEDVCDLLIESLADRLAPRAS